MRKLIALLAVATVGFAGVAVAAKPRAKAKRTSGDIYASLTHSVGGLFYADGDFRDKLLGRGAIIYRVRASTGSEPGSVLIKSPSVTIYTKRGSLSGTGQATQTTVGTGPTAKITVSKGTFNLTKGTGAYKGHTLKGTFGGTQDAQGVYHFTYKGTYR
jgi:hypothetical protein